MVHVESSRRDDHDPTFINFVHFWQFDISSSPAQRLQSTFTTVHNSALYEWKVFMIRANVFNFNNPEEMRQRPVKLSLECVRLVRPFEGNITCSFDLKVVDQTTDKILSELFRYETTTMNIDSPRHQGLSVTEESETDFGRCLRSLFTSKEFKGKVCHITTTIRMDISAFDIGSWPTAAKPVPFQLDFRFKYIYDKKLHNVTINTRERQKYRASREALYACSPLFRSLLYAGGHVQNEISLPDNSFCAIETVIFFAVTGFFKVPPKLTPTLAKEILELGLLILAINRRDLKMAIEQMACQTVLLQADHLPSVVGWLLLASETDLRRLHNVTTSIILTRHLNDFNIDFSADSHASDHNDLRQRIHRRQGFFRAPVSARIHQMEKSRRSVRSYITCSQQA